MEHHLFLTVFSCGSHENCSAVLPQITRQSCGSPKNRSAVLPENRFYGTALRGVILKKMFLGEPRCGS